MISIIAKVKNRSPENTLSILSVQIFSTTNPRRRATKMQEIWARAPPIITPSIPYLAARPIAATYDTSPHSWHMSEKMRKPQVDLWYHFTSVFFLEWPFSVSNRGSVFSLSAFIFSIYSWTSAFSSSLESSLDLGLIPLYNIRHPKEVNKPITRYWMTTLGMR